MSEPIYTTKQAAEYLGIAYVTLKRYIGEPDIPLKGKLLNPRLRVFTQEELDEFKAYMQQHQLGKRGRPDDPKAPYHGWREKYSRKKDGDG